MSNTFTEIYARKYREWKQAVADLETAKRQETNALSAMAKAWTDVKQHMPPGAYSVNGGHVVIVGGGEHPPPLQVLVEREMHPCRNCAKAQGPCRCIPKEQSDGPR